MKTICSKYLSFSLHTPKIISSKKKKNPFGRFTSFCFKFIHYTLQFIDSLFPSEKQTNHYKLQPKTVDSTLHDLQSPVGGCRNYFVAGAKPCRHLSKSLCRWCKALSAGGKTPLHIVQSLVDNWQYPFANGTKFCGQLQKPLYAIYIVLFFQNPKKIRFFLYSLTNKKFKLC